jgi:hypothetical protein
MNTVTRSCYIIILSRDFVLQEHGYHTKDPKVSNAGVVCVRSREQQSMAMEESTCQRAHYTTESDTDFT